METDDLDIPDIDLENIDTSRVCPQPGVYMCRLLDVTKEESSKKKGNWNLVFSVVLLGEVKAIANALGEEKLLEEPQVDTYCPLQAPQAKEGSSKKKKSTYDFRVALAQVCDAFMGTKIGTRPKNPPWKTFVGQECMVEVEIETDPKFGDRPRISKWMTRTGE